MITALALAAALAAPQVIVDPAAVQTVPPTPANGNRGHVLVTGTYRCDPSPLGATGQLSVQLFQPPTGVPVLANRGLINVQCTGAVMPYTVDTVGTVLPGPTRYHVVLNAVPTGQNAVADGVLTVA